MKTIKKRIRGDKFEKKEEENVVSINWDSNFQWKISIFI